MTPEVQSALFAAVYTGAAHTVIAIVAMLLCGARPDAAGFRSLGLAALVIVGAGVAVSVTPVAFPNLFQGSRWNWAGKAAELAVCLAAWAALGPKIRAESGFTFRQHPGSVRASWFAFAFLIVVPTVLSALRGTPKPWSWDTLAFQATMPGFAEEPLYRGVVLALFTLASGKSWTFAGAKVGPGWIASAVLFGLAHGLDISSAGAVQWDTVNFVRTFIGGLFYAWIARRTGSLLLPLLAHNFGNTLAFLVPMLKHATM